MSDNVCCLCFPVKNLLEITKKKPVFAENCKNDTTLHIIV